MHPKLVRVSCEICDVLCRREDDGQLYDGHLIERGPRQLRIEGCALGICGGDELTRIR